ncbi:MAG: hypothetical protein J6B43_07490, partial [Lachnospiraceae bacterium]|nr:hypothetical protein [Lachnospiraceae bacterium]
MENESFILDDILAEFGSESAEPKQTGGTEITPEPESTQSIEPESEPKPKKKAARKAETSAWDDVEPQPKKKESGVRKFFRFMAKLFLILLETVLLVAVLLYGVMYVLAKGPSPTARDLFVMSVRETSAMYWLANLYFTDSQIAQIESAGQQEVEEYVETDTSL